MQVKSLLFLFCLFALLNANSQSPKNINPTMIVKQDGLSHKFTLDDYSLKTKTNHNKRKTYFWFKAQRIIATQGGSSGTLLNGEYQSYYDNSQLNENGFFRKGLKHGTWKSWYRNGKLKSIERWKYGRQLHRQYFFDKQGNIQKRVWIHRLGRQMETMDTTMVLQGRKLRISIMDSLGKVTEIQKFKNGLLHGKQSTFGKDGSNTVSYYRKGVKLETVLKKLEKEGKKKTKEDKSDKRKKEKSKSKKEI